MKYYDGMGVDVTLYVENMVTENRESKEKIDFLSNANIDKITKENSDYKIEIEVSNKQKRRLEKRLKSLKKMNIKFEALLVELENKYVEKIASLEKEAVTQELEPNGVVINI